MRLIPGLLMTALLLGMLLLAVGCSSTAPDESPAQKPATAPADTSPPLGNRVGERALDFTVTTTSGEMRSLTDFMAANQPVIVYFFATW